MPRTEAVMTRAMASEAVKIVRQERLLCCVVELGMAAEVMLGGGLFSRPKSSKRPRPFWTNLRLQQLS